MRSHLMEMLRGLGLWRREHLETRWLRRIGRRYVPWPFPIVYLLLLAIGAATAQGAYQVLIRYLAHTGVLTVSNRIELTKAALTAVAGAGAIAALYVAYRKQRNDEAGHLREQDRLFTDRFSKAAEQLGHEKAAVRLAGVYALGRIADDSPRDRDTCMRTLAAYLRMPYDSKAEDTHPGEQQVRRTTLAAITERLNPEHPERFWAYAYLDLRGAHLEEADFYDTRTAWARFAGATFTEHASFGGAMVENADFAGATFTEHAKFSGATFTEYANFSGATFRGDANFSGATFGGDAFFHVATFRGGAFFRVATFSEESSFCKATFTRSADFAGTTFDGDADFAGTTFDGDADFAGTTFGGYTYFSEAEFSRAAVLSIANSTKVVYSPETRWPSGFVPPDGWRLQPAGGSRTST